MFYLTLKKDLTMTMPTGLQLYRPGQILKEIEARNQLLQTYFKKHKT